MILKAFKLPTYLLITADEAAEIHIPGDRYEDMLNGKPLRLHQKKSGNGPRNHFEYEPRWATDANSKRDT